MQWYSLSPELQSLPQLWFRYDGFAGQAQKLLLLLLHVKRKKARARICVLACRHERADLFFEGKMYIVLTVQ